MSISSHTLNLAWLSSAEDDKRFRKIVNTVMAVMLIVTVIVSYVNVPKPVPTKLELTPERLVKLMLERKKPLPIPKPKELTASEREALRKAEEERKKRLALEQQKIEQERKQLTEEQRKQAEERRKLEDERRNALDAERQKQLAERQRQDEIRRQAEADQQRKEAERQRVAAEKAKGAAAARSIFEDVKSVSSEPSVAAVKGSSGLVSGKKASTQGASDGIARPDILRQRGASAGNSSQGIDTNALPSTKGGGGPGLAGRDTTKVGEVALANLGGGGNSTEAVGKGKGSREGRFERDLNLVFEQNKDALYKLYERARRANPSLSGKVVVELTISASGDVLDVRIIATDLNDLELENKLKLKIKTFNFGAKDVETITVTYPIDFVPS